MRIEGDEAVDPRVVDIMVLGVVGCVVFAGLVGAAVLWWRIS